MLLLHVLAWNLHVFDFLIKSNLPAHQPLSTCLDPKVTSTDLEQETRISNQIVKISCGFYFIEQGVVDCSLVYCKLTFGYLIKLRKQSQ